MLAAFINVLAFWRQQARPDARLLIWWALGVSAGMQLGVHISFLLPGKAILLIFAAILLLMALRNLRRPRPVAASAMSPRCTRNRGMGLCFAGEPWPGSQGWAGARCWRRFFPCYPPYRAGRWRSTATGCCCWAAR
ncbi:TSUP family transporter [Edwardsiella anguillarum]|nr:TSUP family transporter [Edwardsiella anguillarum]